MEREKLKIIYMEEGGKPISHQYLPFSESIRAIKIIEKMRSIKDWIPVSQLSKKIRCNRHSTSRTINKLIGAIRIEPAKYTLLLLIRNMATNPKANYANQRFLKPTTYVCAHQGTHINNL